MDGKHKPDEMTGDSSLSRRKFLTATGGTAAAVAVAGCGGGGNGEGNGGDTTPTETEGPVYTTEAPKAQASWEKYKNNQAPDQDDIRTEAFVEIEEAARDDMVLLPLYHPLGERFSYEWVDVPKRGSLGGHRQQFQEVTVDTSNENKSENVFVLRNAPMSSLDPIQSTDTASGAVIGQMYENLTNYKNGVSTQLENQLATGVNVSDDLLTYTFTIKEGVEYHDGSELVAADFKYAFRRLAESPNSQRANFILEELGVEHEMETVEQDGEEVEQVVPDSLAIEVTGDYEFEVTISSPQPFALDIFAYDSFGAIPEGYVGDVEGYDGEVAQEELSTEVANGTGPFELDEWVVEDQARVTRFDNYHGSTAEVDAVEWSIISDDNAIQTAYIERNLDVFPIPTSFYNPDNVEASEDDQGRLVGTYGELENGDTVDYLGVSDLTVYYVAWNVPQVPRAVRRAVAYVTDHQELIDEVFKSRGQPAYSFTPPGMWPEGTEGYNQWVDEWPYGTNETARSDAEEILSEAGFTSDDPFDITLTTYDSEVFQEFGRLTRDKLDGLGVQLELEKAPFNSLIERGQNGELAFYSLGWAWSWVSPAYGLFGFEPRNTNTSGMPGETNGYYLDWQTGLEDGEQ